MAPLPGGLVSALEPVDACQRRRLDRLAWSRDDDAFEPFVEDGPLAGAGGDERAGGRGVLRGLLQRHPLAALHDVVAKPEFHREWWDSYVAINQRFADKAAEVAADHATVWVQDYQLQLVPQMLRDQRPDLRIGFYLHIPFPPAELFSQLPWRRQILEGLLGADLIGFQLRRRGELRTPRAQPGGPQDAPRHHLPPRRPAG